MSLPTDSYFIYEDLQVQWSKLTGVAPNPTPLLYRVDVSVRPEDFMGHMGAEYAPRQYHFFGPGGKPATVRVGDIALRGSSLSERREGLQRSLDITLEHMSGETLEKKYLFNGPHRGDFVFKLPELVKEMRLYDMAGGFKGDHKLAALQIEKAEVQGELNKERQVSARLLAELEQARKDMALLQAQNQKLHKMLLEMKEDADSISPQDIELAHPDQAWATERKQLMHTIEALRLELASLRPRLASS